MLIGLSCWPTIAADNPPGAAGDAQGLELDTDRYGGDIPPAPIVLLSADPLLCKQACADNPDCKAWTYIKPGTIAGPNPNCWLKSIVPTPTHKENCISGVIPGANFKTFGNGTLYTYKDIPFQIIGADEPTPSALLQVYLQQNPMQSSFNLSGYSASAVHILEYAGWSEHTPDNFLVGHIIVFYKDGTSTPLDLISGVNIAEWAYDKKEIQSCLRHSKIPPAYSWPTSLGSSEKFIGHLFYTKVDTDPTKPLDRLEVRIVPNAAPSQPGCSPEGWYSIVIDAITLEGYPTAGLAGEVEG